MTKTLNDGKRLWGQREADSLYPQCMFEVVDDGFGNFII